MDTTIIVEKRPDRYEAFQYLENVTIPPWFRSTEVEIFCGIQHLWFEISGKWDHIELGGWVVLFPDGEIKTYTNSEFKNRFMEVNQND